MHGNFTAALARPRRSARALRAAGNVSYAFGKKQVIRESGNELPAIATGRARMPWLDRRADHSVIKFLP
jgi:hypothetical protein